MPPRLLLCLLLAAPCAFAQVPNQKSPQPSPGGREQLSNQEREALEGRRNQKIDRIRLEDAGSVIDEVRYGGQTQSITVQPKAAVPRYAVDPSTGVRSWNVLNF